ncbi:MAG: hypothetical protein M0042_02165 [Nitrospiraceae bacterium]|nr:hypothetical protein [Nitrospiraceae bacterium]
MFAKADPQTTWLAGLLDGEGAFFSIRSNVGGKIYRYPHIVIGMTDKDTIDRVGALFGTKTANPDNGEGRKPFYRAQITGAKAADFMQSILPYMSARRSVKIREILLEYFNKPSANEARSRTMKEVRRKKKWISGGKR